MSIGTDHLRLEVEAERPRNTVIFGAPTRGQSAVDLHNPTAWVAKNGATKTYDSSIRLLTIVANTSVQPANLVLGSSPDYTATPGEIWRIIIDSQTGRTVDFEAEAFNGTTSLGIVATARHLANGNPTIDLLYFLTPPSTTKVRVNVRTVAADTYSVRVRIDNTYFGRGPAQLSDWTTSLCKVSLNSALTGFTITPTSAGSSPFAYQSKPVTPGQWCAAAADITGGTGRVRLAFYSSTFAQSQAHDSSVSSSGRVTTPTAIAPSWATSVRVIVYPMSSSGGAPALTDVVTVTKIVLNIEDKKIFADRTGWEQSTRPNNLLPNSSGELGSIGWETPLSNSALNVVTESGVKKLRFVFEGGRPMYLRTEAQPVTPGKWLGASWTIQARWGYRQVIEFLDASLTVVSTSTPTTILNLNFSTFATPFKVPTNANYARLRFDFYYDNVYGVDPPDSPNFPGYHSLHEVVMAEGDTVEQASGLPFIEAVKWLDILAPTHELTINREALDVGTLTATVLDRDLDPVQAPDIRPGHQVRVMARTPTDTWEPLYTGLIGNASVNYDLRATDQSKATRIFLTATDNIKQLANVTKTDGVGTIPELPEVLEGTGVPYVVNGSSAQIYSATKVSKNDNASALDQVAITRDTALGYAWVGRDNYLRVNSPTSMNNTSVGVFDEAVCRTPTVDFNTGECVNEVTITYLRYNPADDSTEEIIYGPYRDASSIATWGRYAASYTVQTATESPTAIAAYAKLILTANSQPKVRINELDLAIKTPADITSSRALVDLYDLATVRLTSKGINESSRITGINHHITPDGWTMKLSFAVDGAVAAAQTTPSPSGGMVSSGWINVTTFQNSWANYNAAGGTFGVAQYRKVGTMVYLRGMIRNGTLGSTMFILPEGFRPQARELFAMSVAATSGGTNTGGRVDVRGTDGAVYTSGVTDNGYVSLSGIVFFTD